jgi:hypothetical protein
VGARAEAPSFAAQPGRATQAGQALCDPAAFGAVDPDQEVLHATTLTKHWSLKYPNLIRGTHVSRPEEVWLSEITYLKTDEGYYYLSLVTDASSEDRGPKCFRLSQC